MASIVDYESQRRRRILPYPSHTGVDDRHVARGSEAKKKHSHSGVSTNADETNRQVLKRVEYLGTEVKRAQPSVRRNRAADEHVADGRTARSPIADGRTARSPMQSGSEAIGSRNRHQLTSTTRNYQPRESSRTSSRMNTNYTASTPERSQVSFQKNGDTFGSLSNELSHRSSRSSASTPVSRSSARTNHASKQPDKSSTLNPIVRVSRAEARHRSREDRSDARVGSPSRGAEARHRSREERGDARAGSPSRGSSHRRVASPATSHPNARNKQVSKSPGKQSKMNRTLSPERHLCPCCASKNDGSNAFGSYSPRRSKSTSEVQNRSVLNRRSACTHREALRTSSPRDVEAFLRGNGTRRSSESTVEYGSPRSLPNTSMVRRRNSIIANNRSNPAYPNGRYHDSHYADGDESRQDSNDLSTAMDTVVDSIRSTAREIFSSDIEDVWLNIAESQKVSVDTLIDGVSDQLDDLEDSLFGPTEEEEVKPAKSWFPMVRMKVSW